jgi:hypothetical protein
MNCNDDITTATTHTPLQGVPIEFEEAPRVEPALRNRVKTPERQPATTRSAEYSRDIDRSRRRLDDDGDAAADNDGATTCSMASDDEADQMMSSLDEIDRRILASIIMGADVTEVFSPERVNRLATKFGLTPGASLDLTNGWDFSLVADRNRAWKLVKSSTPYVIIGSPPCTLFSNLQELNKHIHREYPEWLRKFEEAK